MTIPWRSIKPGWYLLAFLLLYSIVLTVALQRSNRILQRTQVELVQASAVAEEALEPQEPLVIPEPELAPEGLWYPVVGANLPQNPDYLPGAAKPYRSGTNQGFDFYGGDVGIPIPFGTPVIAASDGVVERADLEYSELSEAEWQALLNEVADGASAEQLDRLRGRQLWLKLNDGRSLRYGHLAGIRQGIAEGQQVYRGQVLGFVGNSGTDTGITGTDEGARLHFEIWQPDGSFFGENLDTDELRLAAASLFVGP